MAATDPEHDYNVFRDHEITVRRSLAIPLTDLDRTLARDWANILDQHSYAECIKNATPYGAIADPTWKRANDLYKAGEIDVPWSEDRIEVLRQALRDSRDYEAVSQNFDGEQKRERPGGRFNSSFVARGFTEREVKRTGGEDSGVGGCCSGCFAYGSGRE